VGIVGHLSPDGDSLGATLGLYHLLQSSGVHAVEIINIDHHASNRGDFGVAWVDSSYAAVGQQVYHLAKSAKWNIGAEAATCLYTAIATDTGFFRHSNTTPAVLRDAAELMELGADVRIVVENVSERKTMGELCIIREALDSLSQECGGQVTIIELNQDNFAHCSIEPDEAEGMVEYARAVPDTKVAVLLREVTNQSTKVSLRARTGIDVSRIAVAFGGGGHKLAAGCTIPAPLAVARQKLLAEIRGVLDFA